MAEVPRWLYDYWVLSNTEQSIGGHVAAGAPFQQMSKSSACWLRRLTPRSSMQVSPLGIQTQIPQFEWL